MIIIMIIIILITTLVIFNIIILIWTGGGQVGRVRGNNFRKIGIKEFLKRFVIVRGVGPMLYLKFPF